MLFSQGGAGGVGWEIVLGDGDPNQMKCDFSGEAFLDNSGQILTAGNMINQRTQSCVERIDLSVLLGPLCRVNVSRR